MYSRDVERSLIPVVNNPPLPVVHDSWLLQSDNIELHPHQHPLSYNYWRLLGRQLERVQQDNRMLPPTANTASYVEHLPSLSAQPPSLVAAEHALLLPISDAEYGRHSKNTVDVHALRRQQQQEQQQQLKNYQDQQVATQRHLPAVSADRRSSDLSDGAETPFISSSMKSRPIDGDRHDKSDIETMMLRAIPAATCHR